MARRRPPLPALPPTPPKLRAYLQSLGLKLYDPALRAVFASGVRAAEKAIKAEERWMRVRCKPAEALHRE